MPNIGAVTRLNRQKCELAAIQKCLRLQAKVKRTKAGKTEIEGCIEGFNEECAEGVNKSC
jgi:hypothetical protein